MGTTDSQQAHYNARRNQTPRFSSTVHELLRRVDHTTARSAPAEDIVHRR